MYKEKTWGTEFIEFITEEFEFIENNNLVITMNEWINVLSILNCLSLVRVCDSKFKLTFKCVSVCGFANFCYLTQQMFVMKISFKINN